MGIEKMLLRARSAIFWPGLTADVTNIAKNCQVCQKYAPKQSQEPILVHEPTATRPWFKLGSDIFEVKGKYYIVVADYYSRFPYVKQLTNITSRSIINVFKTLFADHGFCEILCTDNGPSYVSKEFTTFLNDCSIRHITSDPMYPQSNGFAESMVKVMKNLITKAIASNEDPNWALLAYRATPLSASLPSPAQMLHGRPLRTNLPSPRPAAQSDNTLEAQSCRQQSYAQATSSKQLSPLREGQSVTMYNHKTHTWKPATITQVLPAPGLISYQQMTVLFIVETGVIFVLLRQQRLIMLHHHKSPIVLYPIRVYPLHSQVVIPVVLMLHNHKMDLLMMDNMLLVMDVYRNQPPDISRDIDYEH